MKIQRSSGLLLHPTSLPGTFGIGDLGAPARRFLDFLSQSRQSLWQVLPLNPTGPTHSPYQAFSAFAGNPLLISPEILVVDGLLKASDLKNVPSFPADRVDFPAAIAFKTALLHQAHKRFRPDSAYDEFCAHHASWLDDYSLFMALKDAHQGAAWNMWGSALAGRKSGALKKARAEFALEIDFERFTQFLFFRQHGALKSEANARGIRIIGDLPIFVGHNSADVWANPHLFHLNKDGHATAVAGVPPDYFSKTGQLWGNPLYRWDAMAENRYAWWLHRLRMALTLYDVVRIDHFRGFQAYWSIPGTETTAMNGRWEPGPDSHFFTAVREEFGQLSIIAEDLGLITPAVERLRDRFRLPGMKVLQFAFSDPKNVYLPHNYLTPNCVVYTGTHDNNTNRGWWQSLKSKERSFAREYLGTNGRDISWDLIRLAHSSIAATSIVPLQDVLDLGSEARMNTPGVESGNWGWRCPEAALKDDLASRLGELTVRFGRAPVVRAPLIRAPRAAMSNATPPRVTKSQKVLKMASAGSVMAEREITSAKVDNGAQNDGAQDGGLLDAVIATSRLLR